MKRKTYRIVWEDDPPRHDAQPSENRAPDTAGRNHAGPAFEQQQSNGMPPTPTSGDSDMPAADETTRSSADKTGSGFVRSETTEQQPSKAIASPTASHPAEPADADRYRTYAPERLMQAGFGSPVARNTPGYAERHAPQESIYPGPAPCRAIPARLRRERPTGKSRRTVRDAAKSRPATDRRDDRLAAELAESLRARIGYHRRAAIRQNRCRTSLFLILGTCL